MGGRATGAWWWRRAACAAVLCLSFVPAAGQAQQGRAGRTIDNVADATWTVDREQKAARSNVDRRRIDERLDLTLVADGTAPVRAADGTLVGRATLTNTGNGLEAFFLGGTAIETARIVLIAIDGDGDGVLGAADTRIDAGTPVLAPGATLPLLLVFRAEEGATAARVALSAQAATGSGMAGTVFAGRGDGGSDAVVGPTRAAATVTFALRDPAAPTLAKSQTVRAPDGSARPMRGATITYSLRAEFPAALRAARIDDSIPPGTRYVAGSTRLDGAIVPDSTALDAIGVHAALGPVAAGTARTLEFQVVIE